MDWGCSAFLFFITERKNANIPQLGGTGGFNKQMQRLKGASRQPMALAKQGDIDQRKKRWE
jgi:hypothetical protein